MSLLFFFRKQCILIVNCGLSLHYWEPFSGIDSATSSQRNLISKERNPSSLYKTQYEGLPLLQFYLLDYA